MSSPEKIRRELRKYTRLFIDKNCCYSEAERMAAQDLLHRVGTVNPTYEALNREHPDHGQKVKQ